MEVKEDWFTIYYTEKFNIKDMQTNNNLYLSKIPNSDISVYIVDASSCIIRRLNYSNYKYAPLSECWINPCRNELEIKENIFCEIIKEKCDIWVGYETKVYAKKIECKAEDYPHTINCVNCGAVLHSCICEYCGAEYRMEI